MFSAIPVCSFLWLFINDHDYFSFGNLIQGTNLTRGAPHLPVRPVKVISFDANGSEEGEDQPTDGNLRSSPLHGVYNAKVRLPAVILIVTGGL